MKLKTLVFGVLCMLVMQLSDFNVRALARKQLTLLPTQDPCIKCALLDANKEDQDSTTKTINNKSLHSSMVMMASDTVSHQHRKNLRRTLSQKKSKKERWLAVDEVDYLGPRTHPPTKPPRK